jgi:site-specific DNA recombinase
MADTGGKTGIIYCRVSSAEQVAGTSLAMQEHSCREYAEREKITIIGCFIEEGESAKTANRTEFQKALGFCAEKKNSVDFFIVHKIDRFARNQEDHAITQAILRRSNTKLRSVSEQIDETPVGKMMEGVLSVFAEFDNNVRASRSMSGMIERVKKGVWVWKAPLGYKRMSEGGNLVIDDSEAPYIRLAFEEWAKGTYSLRSLAAFLNERGFRTRSGRKIISQLLYHIIHNQIYNGTIRAFGLEVKGAFTPLISEELFLKCQTPMRRKFNSGSHTVDSPDFPLRRFVNCTACESRYTGSFSTGRKGVRYPYYHHQKQGCALATSIPKDTVEEKFIEFLGEISPKHKQYEKAFKAVVMDVWQSNYKKLDGENARIRKEITVLETERQHVFDMQRAGIYTDAEFIEQKDYINTQVQAKKLLLEEKRIEEFSMEEALNYCFEFVRDSGKTWTEFENEPAYRLRFQNMIFPEKVSFDGKKFGTKKTALVYKLNEASDADLTNLVRPLGFEPRTISLRGSCSTN